MKVLLVDDHALFAKSLSIALCDFPEIEQFSSTKDIQHLEELIAGELPDILLIDINLGGLTDEDGLMLTKHLLEHFPEQKIVILSGYNLPVYRKEAKEKHVLLELNNTSLNPDGPRQGAYDNDVKMLNLCKEMGVCISIGSDAHIKESICGFDRAYQVIKDTEFPEKLIVNSDYKLYESYIGKRKL